MTLLRHGLLGFALLCCALPALATSARVESLGGGDDYFEDVDNVLRWYGSLASYGGTALFDLGNKQEGSAIRNRGATLLADLASDKRWGTGGLFLFGDNDDEVIRLAWGRRLGGLQIGLQWKLTWKSIWWSDYVADSTSGFHSDDQVFGAGLRWDLADRTYLDVAADVTRTGRGFELDDVMVEPKQYDLDTYGWRCRVFHALSDATVIVPLATYERRLQTAFDPDRWGVFDLDRDILQLGLGLNHFPSADTMLLGSFTYALMHEAWTHPRDVLDEYDLGSSSHLYTLRLGVEKRLLAWLTLRAGARQILIVYEDEIEMTLGESTSSDTYSEESLDLSLGLALHFGPFDADFAFQDAAPFNFGAFITQTDSYETSTWSRITLQYVF